MIAIAAVVGIAITLSLGFWQWGRAQQRNALHDAIAQRQAMPAVPQAELLGAGAQADLLLHRSVALRGQWIPERTVWLENRQLEGVPGFYVVTPLRLEGTAAAILVQRGWAQRNFRQRDQLPPLETPDGMVEVRGRLAPPPAKLYAFDTEDKGAIRQNLDLARFRAETGLPLLQLSVQQAGAPSQGLLRQWPQPGSGAEKNIGYAFQWWAIAAVIAILYAWFQLVLPRRRQARSL